MEQNRRKTSYKKEPLQIRTQRFMIRWLCRALVLLLVCCGLYVYSGYAHLDRIFSGPSDTAKLQTLNRLSKDSRTAWIPGVFLNADGIAALRGSHVLPEDDAAAENPYIPVESAMYQGTPDDEWADWPDGIQIRKIGGPSYQAYAVLIRDPSRVYLGLANEELDPSLQGKTIAEIMEAQQAVVAINAAEISKVLSPDKAPGSTPLGQIISHGRIAWDSGTPQHKGFVGFNSQNKLSVANKTPKIEEIVKDMDIRDGCATGPVLIENQMIQEKKLKQFPQVEPRSAIGQRQDGTVIFLCLDGWLPSSAGGTLMDLALLMKELDAYNACALDGGNSSIMMYRDTAGKFGAPNEIYTVNGYAQLQAESDPLPTYWLVQSVKED